MSRGLGDVYKSQIHTRPAPAPAAAGPPAAAPAAAPPPVPAPPPPVATQPIVTASTGGKPAIDRLFHLMVGAKASDLHLSTGMPPRVRRDGKMQPLDPGVSAMAASDVEALLDPIMPEKNREFERRHDTDFAHEIKGLARFRANVFLDRKGRGAVFRVIPRRSSAEESGLSPHILKPCKLHKARPGDRADRFRQVDHVAMIDYINRTAPTTSSRSDPTSRTRTRAA